MQFDLVKIDQPNNPNTNQIVVRQMSQTEKKQMNKTAQCPNCLKYMTKKTLRYSHKCLNIDTTAPVEASKAEQTEIQKSDAPPEPQPELAQPPKPQPKQITDDDIASYIQQMKRNEHETRQQKRAERMNYLFKHAV